MSRFGSPFVSIVAAAVAACALLVAQVPSTQAAGRSSGEKMTKGQKAAAMRNARAKFARCKRKADKQKVYFTDRRDFIKTCMTK